MNESKIVDRQVGRNAQLFARAIAQLDEKEKRFPYIRILVSLIELAHPELSQAPHKPKQIAHTIHQMSDGQIAEEEISEVVRVRDEERGVYYD